MDAKCKKYNFIACVRKVFRKGGGIIPETKLRRYTMAAQFRFYEPRGKSGGLTLKEKRMTPGIRFSPQSFVLNKFARKLLEDNGVPIGPRIRIGFLEDGKGYLVRIESSDKQGLLIKKTKVYARGMYKNMDMEWLAGFFVPVHFEDGGLVGYIDINSLTEDEEEEIEEAEEDSVEAKPASVRRAKK